MGHLQAPHVRTDHHQVRHGLGLEVVVHHRGGVEVIHRDVEETLNLLGVKIHRQHPVGAGGHEQVGHQLGGDGNPRLVLAVLARVPVKGQHGGDAAGAGAAQRIHHDEQLHQVLVARRAGRLDHVRVLAAHVLLDLDKGLAVREGRHGAAPQLEVDRLANCLGEGPVGIAAEYFHVDCQLGFTGPTKGAPAEDACVKRGGI